MKKSISMEIFEHNARQIQSKHVMYLFDSCFSGSIFALSRAVPSAISYKTANPVRQFITAGDEGEEVPDKSIFKSQFIDGIRGNADSNKDGYITGTELGEFLQTTVVNYSRESQHPQYGKIRDPKLDKGDYIILSNNSRTARISNRKSEINWTEYNQNMKQEVYRLNNLLKDRNVADTQKLQKCDAFLTSYSDDNPYSSIDNKMRDFVINKRSEFQQKVDENDVIWINNMHSNAARYNNVLLLFDSVVEPEDEELYLSGQLGLRIYRKIGLSLRFGKSTEYKESQFLGGLLLFLSDRSIFNIQAGYDEYSEFSLAAFYMHRIFGSLYLAPCVGVGFDGPMFKFGLGFGFGF